MKAKPTLVGTKRGVELHSKASVHPADAIVIHPGDSEDDGALRLQHALKNCEVLRVFADEIRDGVDQLFGCLNELILVGVLLPQIGSDILLS